MASSKFTEMQYKAVTEEGKNVLVSASAGSGKTYVMIERVIRLIVEGKADVNSVLAVTYTTAAADEMKQKLVKAIIAEINAGHDAERFRKALADVPTASISTFHGFCSSLLKNYFYAAELDPSFTVLDESESRTLKNRAMDGLFTDLYEAEDEEFLYLVRIFRSGRSDRKLKYAVNALYDFATAEKSVSEFLLTSAEGVNEQTFAAAQNELLAAFIKKFNELKRIGENVRAAAESLGMEKYRNYLEELQTKVRICLNCPSYRELYEMAAISISSLPPVKTEDESLLELKERVKNFKGELTDLCADILKSSPNGDETADLNEYLKTERATRAFCLLTESFRKRYAEEKRAAAAVDFSDLEHLAYELLVNNPDVLEAVKSKYAYVFADEYQDVNGVQEAILSLITDGNLFMVGDVKQSIYAFRGCDPYIFAQKYEDFENGDGIPVSLDVNFRSSDGVLKAVNDTFSPMMTREFGGVDYAANPMVGSGLYEKGYGECILHQITPPEKQETLREGVYDILEAVTKTDEEEAFYEGLEVGKIIADEIGKPIYDFKTGETRAATPKDIAVLTRNSSGFTTEIIKQLKRLSLPVASSAKNPILDYPEIKLLIDVLRVIDRFADDAPLLAVLFSPVGSVTKEEAAKIRAESPKKNGDEKTSFFDCYENYILHGSDEKLREKLLDFDAYISKIRLIAEFNGASELLKRILSETGLDLEILSMPMGETRLKRVERFIAEGSSGGKKLSVSEFLTRVENNFSDVSVGSSDGDDSIAVMSMHASKGLEFPIVILAGLAKKFNVEDLRKEILTDRKRGVALKYYDEEEKTVKTTLVRSAFKEIAHFNLIKEEMRVFYVAMTRAKDRLHLVCSCPVDKNDDYASVLFADKFAAFLRSDNYKSVAVNAEDLISGGEGEEERTVLLSGAKESLADKIYDYVSYKYPYETDCTLPVKRAVTRLVDDAVAPVLVDPDDEYVKRRFDEFARSRGTAYHAFLQNCDLTASSAGEEVKRLLNAGKLTSEQADLLDESKLNRILKAEIFKDLTGYKLYREQPFVVALPADEISEYSAKDDILVQGVIDLLAIKDGAAIIVDYKNSSKKADELKLRYEKQLAIYKRAVEKTLRLRVEKTILFNLTTLDEIPV